jgi:histidinol-phosphate phosphatase family protein
MVPSNIIINKPDQAVILCGGKGTRLLPYTQDTPKPMMLCNGKPFLWYLLTQLNCQGINRFVLLIGYLGHIIEDYFGNGDEWGWKIEYSKGPVDWDTGKRIWKAKELFDKQFLLLYSDNFITLSLEKLVKSHKKNNKALTFTVSKKNPGNVQIGNDSIVRKYDNQRSSNLDYVEIGFMIIEAEQMFKFYDNEDCNFSKILKNMSNQGQINSYIHRDTYHSISDMIRWKKTERYLGKNKIILIDRDGVINQKSLRGEYVAKWSNFKWIPDTINTMKILAKEGFEFIVITNQAGVARKIIDENELAKIHQNMTQELEKHGVNILDAYVCMHHWDDRCSCRKPKPGMFFQASKDWLFRLDQTFFIGDDPRDCQAAFNAGCMSIFIGDSQELNNLKTEEMPTYIFSNLSSSIEALKSHY